MDPSKSRKSQSLIQRSQIYSEELFLTRKNNKKFCIGRSDFCLTSQMSPLIVDKTLFIKQVLEDANSYILITRPRRWGKTLNMTMLKDFLQPHSEDRNLEQNGDPAKAELFFDKKISSANISYPNNLSKNSCKIQGKIPVIFVTFSIDKPPYNLERLALNISKAYKEHAYLERFFLLKLLTACNIFFSEEENLKIASASVSTIELSMILDELIINRNPRIVHHSSYNDLEKFRRILNVSQDSLDISDSLVFLSEMLFEYYNKKQRCFIIIDEYDQPFTLYTNLDIVDHEITQKISKESPINVVKDAINDILIRASKFPDTKIDKVILTGVFPIAEVNIDSGFNNIHENTLLCGKYSDCFGFSYEEVKWLLAEGFAFQNDDENRHALARITEWYNGYKIGNCLLFNPWDIVNCLENASMSNANALQPYWVKSGKTGILTNALKNPDCRKAIAKLFSSYKIDFACENKFGISSEDSDEMSLINVMLHHGYLTMSEETGVYRIPNKELKWFFYYNYFKNWLREENIQINIDHILLKLDQSVDSVDEYKRVIKQFILKRLDNSLKNEAVFQILLNAPSLYLSATENKSKFKAIPEYPTQFGKRIDCLLVPNHSGIKTVIIQEYKILKHESGVDQKVEDAIWQIYANLYAAEPLELNKEENLWELAISRAIVFYLDNLGKWRVEIKEFRHKEDQVRAIKNLFLKNNKLIEKLMSKKPNICGPARSRFLNKKNVESLYELIEKHSENSFGVTLVGESYVKKEIVLDEILPRRRSIDELNKGSPEKINKVE